MPGAYVVIGESKISSDFVEGNVTVGADGKWRMNFLTQSYSEGVHYFTLSGYKPYTTVSANMTFSFTIVPSQSSAKPEDIKCLANRNVTDTNTYILYGQTVECSVVTSDPNTKAMLSSGYTHWGDVDTTKTVEPQGNTVIPGSYLNGVYTVKIVGDYRGYNLTRHIWFENASGKSATLSISMSDPSSDDYAQATAYLDIQRAAYDKARADAAARTTPSPVQTLGTPGESKIQTPGTVTNSEIAPSSGTSPMTNTPTPKGSTKKPYTAPVILSPIQPAGNSGIVPPSSSIEKNTAQPKLQSSKKAERERKRLLRKMQSTRTR